MHNFKEYLYDFFVVISENQKMYLNKFYLLTAFAVSPPENYKDLKIFNLDYIHVLYCCNIMF